MSKGSRCLGPFLQGSSTVQYKEYERAAMAAQPKKIQTVGSNFSLATAGAEKGSSLSLVPSGQNLAQAAKGSSLSLVSRGSTDSIKSLEQEETEFAEPDL